MERIIDTKKTKELPTYLGEPDYDSVLGFIFRYGRYHCKILVLANKEKIINALKEEKGYTEQDFDKETIKVIQDLEQQSVMCYILGKYDKNPDIFIYPDDNIPFSLGCFI